MRIVITGKVKSGVALGFAHASEPAFRELMGTVLPLVKQHVVSLGGRVDSADDHVTVNLLKVNYEDQGHIFQCSLVIRIPLIFLRIW